MLCYAQTAIDVIQYDVMSEEEKCDYLISSVCGTINSHEFSYSYLTYHLTLHLSRTVLRYIILYHITGYGYNTFDD